MERRLLAIVGPTATGKSEAGMLLAEALAGEIVSADSMQVYRGMDIGTAKPTLEQRARVPHHLIDIIDPDEPFSVADYQARADAALADIWERDRQPILVGGSGLYVRAVLEEMDFAAVPPDPEFRRRLLAEAKSKGTRALHEWLAEVDPAAAARIHPNDQKRIIRALEVAEGGAASASRSGKVDRQRRPRYNSTQFGLTLERERLYQRIDARVDTMIARGLVEEVKGLLARGCGEDLVSMQGLGYAQLAPYVRGKISLEEAVSRLQRDTRRFAKRQLTWFRADPGIEWRDVGQAGGAAAVVEAIRSRWQ
ncbi:MAG TPA: tRNA (adenosine(37)-N6)-dimethylallyltransferase MiaA [Armatimonadota bacterium]|nr:tRNA (adenosine(37)-N6)-dimethylallyltransferase MiaA [Armatimonadota bacterium]